MNKLVASYGIVIVISVGIPFHELLPCGISRKCKSQDSLTFHNNYKMDKHYQGAYLPQSLYYGASEGYSFLAFSLSFSSLLFCLTCPFLSLCLSEFSTFFF